MCAIAIIPRKDTESLLICYLQKKLRAAACSIHRGETTLPFRRAQSESSFKGAADSQHKRKRPGPGQVCVVMKDNMWEHWEVRGQAALALAVWAPCL